MSSDVSMSEEARVLERKAAYIDRVRALGRGARNGGFLACLVGVLALLLVRRESWAPEWALWPALAIIVMGWGLLAYSIWRRLAFVRAHPFEDEA
ncbi:MAG: hypothetical protein ACYC8V_11040 [Caulobacteraceae bacterium]